MKVLLFLFLIVSIVVSQRPHRFSAEAEGSLQMVLTQETVSWSDKNFHFRGYDPELEKRPIFELIPRADIDLEKKDYKLNVFSKIRIDDLSIVDTKYGKKKYSYTLSIQVLDENDTIRFEDMRNVSNTFVEDENGVVYLQDNIQKFTLNMPKDNVKIRAIILDELSGISYSQISEYTPKISDGKLLISDIRYYDHASKKIIFSPSNNIGNRKDSLTILVDFLNLDKYSDYALDISLVKEKPSVKKLLDAVFSPMTFLGNTLSKTLRSAGQSSYVDTTRKSLFSHFEDIKIKSFKTKRITVSKNLFREIEYDKRNRAYYPINVNVNVFQYVSDATDAELKGAGIQHIDSVNANDVDYTKTTLFDHENKVLLSNISENESSFTMFWEHMPQTEQDLEYTLSMMSGVMKDEQYDNINDAKLFKDKLKNYYNFLTELKQEKEFKHEMIAQKQAMRKAQFCIDNFSSVRKVGIATISRTFFNDGHITDKGRVYQKYGLPKSINGDNYITKEGKLKNIRNMPIQEWRYKNKRFIFYGSKLIKRISDII